jgi:hypothetical protein
VYDLASDTDKLRPLMADPAPFTPGYDYTAFTAGLGDGTFPGPQIDADFQAVQAAIAGLVAAMLNVRRSDGKLQNESVAFESLGPTARQWILGVASGEATSAAIDARNEAEAFALAAAADAAIATGAVEPVEDAAAAATAAASAAAASAVAAATSAATAAEDVAEAIAALDQWEVQPVGVIFALADHVTGVAAPPTDKAYRYIRLTAGQTGSGQYNNGVLTSESVSGSAPEITATAVVSLSGSPLNGQTVRLLNTERRFLRAGSAGTLEDSANKSHNHGGAVGAGGSHSHPYDRPVLVGVSGSGSGALVFGATSGTTGTAAAHDHTISADGGTEARPRNMGVTYYMRVK